MTSPQPPGCFSGEVRAALACETGPTVSRFPMLGCVSQGTGSHRGGCAVSATIAISQVDNRRLDSFQARPPAAGFHFPSPLGRESGGTDRGRRSPPWGFGPALTSPDCRGSAMSLDDLPFPPSHATVGRSEFAIPLGYIRTHKPTLAADKCRTRTQVYIPIETG